MKSPLRMASLAWLLWQLPAAALPSPSIGGGATFEPIATPVAKRATPVQRATPARPVAPRQAQAPDERPLWNLLHAGRLTELESKIAHLRAATPGWRPPAQLVSLLEAAMVARDVQQAQADRDFARIVGLAAAHPGFFDAAHLDFRWALIEATHALGRDKAAYDLVLGTLGMPVQLNERMATLQKAARWLPDATYDRLLRETLTRSRSEDETSAIEELVAEVRFGHILAVEKAAGHEEAARLSAELAPLVVKHRRTAMALAFGWMEYHLGRVDESKLWFDRVLEWQPTQSEAAYGRAIIALGAGDLSMARRLAWSLNEAEARVRSLRSNVLLTQAHHDYQAKDYETCLKILQEAPLEPESLREATALRAWAEFQLGAYSQAADLFAQLHHERPDPDVATGLYYGLKNAGRNEELAALQGDPVIARLSREARAQSAFESREYARAYALAPEHYPGLRGLESPEVTSGAEWRSRSGAEGLSRLQLMRLPLFDGALYQSGGHSLKGEFDGLFLNSGSMAAQAVVGNVPMAASQLGSVPDPSSSGIAGRLSYEHQGPLATFLQLGFSPTGGPVSVLPTLRAELKAADPIGRYALSAFSESVQDSRLSFIGAPDPYGSQAWGRVMRSGLGLSHDLSLTSADSLRLSGQFDTLNGQGVASNTHGSVGLQVQHEIRLPLADWSAVGIGAAFESYRQNLSYFTLGQGGYFSPQQYGTVRLTWDAVTSELKPFVLSAHVGVGPSYEQNDASPYLPLNPDGRFYPAYSHAGMDYGAELKLVRQLTDSFQAGARLAFDHNLYYDQQTVMGFFRYFFQPRATVVQADLPR